MYKASQFLVAFSRIWICMNLNRKKICGCVPPAYFVEGLRSSLDNSHTRGKKLREISLVFKTIIEKERGYFMFGWLILFPPLFSCTSALKGLCQSPQEAGTKLRSYLTIISAWHTAGGSSTLCTCSATGKEGYFLLERTFVIIESSE